MSTALLEEGRTFIAAGEPVRALELFARALVLSPSTREPYDACAKALVASIQKDLSGLASWDPVHKLECYRTLVLQVESAHRPLSLALAVAEQQTARAEEVTERLAAELSPIMRELLDRRIDTPSFVVLALLLRDHLGVLLSPSDARDLHHRRLSEFGREDLALLYSVLFSEKAFAKNRDEFADYIERHASEIRRGQHLRVIHVLTYEWLTGKTLFESRDASDLRAFLDGHFGTTPASGDERAAARTLLLRHCDDVCITRVDELERFGLGGDLHERRRDLALSPNEGRAHRFRAYLLGRREYQAVNAARNSLARRVRFINRGQRRVRVAVCVSGQLRGFRQALASWQRELFGAIDCDYYVHSWTSIGRAKPTPTRFMMPFEGERFSEAYKRIGVQLGEEAIHARYPTLFRVLEEGNFVTEAEVAALYGAKRTVLEDDNAPPFQGYPNAHKMYYKVRAAFDLALDSGREYDLYVRTRPDILVRLAGFDWRDMSAACRAEPVLYCENPMGLHYGNIMMGDQFAIGARPAMEAYCSTIDVFPQLAKAELYKCEEGFFGHWSLGYTCWIRGVRALRAPIRFGALLEATRLGTREVLDALERDATGRSDGIDAQMVAAARADLHPFRDLAFRGRSRRS